MAEGDYQRLLTWAKGSKNQLDISRPEGNADKQWHITVSITSPVKFYTSGKGSTVDVAAAKIIADLTTVGVTIG